MNNATNKTVIRWYNDVTYTISELFACRSNDIIEGMGLLEIINAVLTHGSFNPICSKTGNKRFGLAITLVKRGDDANDYIKSEPSESNTVIIEGEEHLIEPGMCFSIEPGIYLPGRFGVRIEDIVVATEDGGRRLNNTNREMRIVS